MKVFYHYDADGRLSAFLVAREFRDCLSRNDLIEIDHVRPIPVEKVAKGELVFIVDFSFSGKLFDDFKEIINRAGYVVWIDHHADFQKMELENQWVIGLPGIRRANIVSSDSKKIKFSGAALTMIYMGMLNNALGCTCDFIGDNRSTEEKVKNLLRVNALRQNRQFEDTEFTFDVYPHNITKNLADMVEWVSDYDTFSRYHKEFEEFYYGISRINQDPFDGEWAKPISDVIKIGSEIKKIIDLDNEQYLKRNAMIVSIRPEPNYDEDHNNGEGAWLFYEEIKILAVNKNANSFIFNSVPNIEKNFPVRMVFSVVDDHQAKVTFFGNEGSSLARELAVYFGGGGHPQAAGCRIALSNWRYNFKMVQRYEDWLKEYDEHALDSEVLRKEVEATKSNKTNDTGLWDIWCEGYMMNGGSGTASIVASQVEAPTFGDACKIALHDNSDFRYGEDHCSLWGCRLFDNEVDARSMFG